MNRRNAWMRADVPLVRACLLFLAMLLAACSAPAPVVQGKVLEVDSTSLRVQDETQPDTVLAIDISTAETGGRPAVGDVVRVVYRDAGGARRALAVMNLTRQQRTDARGR
jgi:hypothetical protein